jgi:putative hemolysin
MMLSILIISLLLTGFFAGIEIAFISANKLGIELKKKQGKQSGITLSRFLDNPSRFLLANLTAFYIFLVAFGLTVSGLMGRVWQMFNIVALDSKGIFLLVLDFFFAAIVLLIVQFIFKAIFRAKNDSVLSSFAGLLSFFYSIFGNISALFSGITNSMLKYLFNIRVDEHKKPFTRIDSDHYFQQSNNVDEEKNTDLNQELFENALSLPGVKVRSCLVPRKEIIAVELNTPIQEVVEKLMETMLSKLVVYEGNIDNILGYVHQLDMFKNAQSLQSILLPIPAVPETMSVTDLIGKFSKERKSIAWVVDEFGGTAGIVTMEDLLEEIFGEIKDEYDTEDLVDKQLSENEFMFSGRVELDTISEKYNFEFDLESADTLSGYIIEQNENLPKQGDRIIAGNYQFDIMNMSDTRIELVKMKVLK